MITLYFGTWYALLGHFQHDNPKPGQRVRPPWAVARVATAGRGAEGPVAAAAVAAAVAPVAGAAVAAVSAGP